jgi:teichuronic acid biosynthesis glycosyltransferase TuaC
MKVLFLVSNYPHQNNPVSGNFYRIICEQLASKGMDVHVICPVPYIPLGLGFFSKRLNVYRFYPEFENRNRVKIYRPKFIRLPFGNLRTKYAHANKRVIELTKKINPDIIDVQHFYPAFPNGWFALNIKKLFGIPYIFTNIGVAKHMSEDDDKFEVDFHRELLTKASKVFAVSTELISEMHHVFKIQSSITRHGIEVAKYKSFQLQKHEINKLEFKVIYVGEVSNLKGIDTLLAAIEILNDADIHFTFVGKNFLGENIAELTNKKNTTYLGRLTHEEALNEISKSDLLILPTKFEGMPNVLKEAGILNVPVISTNVGGIPELLNNGDRGELFEAGNSTELAQKIEMVKNNYSQAQHKSALLNAYMIEEYDIEKNTNDLINTYKNILNAAKNN